MLTKRKLKTLFLILFFISARAIAIAPTDDTFIDELYGDNVNGTAPSLIVRCMNLNPGELDTLIKFDLTNVPAEATIKSAVLNLYYFHWNDLNPTGRQLDIYRITQDWSEDTTSWNNRPNYNSTAIDSVFAPGSYGWVQWDVTSSTQEFHDGTYPNYGWQIMDVEPSGNSMIYFHSNNYNTDPNLRPYLQMTTNIIYVDENATGANDGSSWTDAYNYLQDALNKPPTAGDQIWVAAGTYKPDQGGGMTSGDRTATFQLISNVGIYGGFPSGGGTWQQRDPDAYQTILSGDINALEVNTDNSYHVVTGSGTNSTALLDGFTITAGYANSSWPYNRGAGMFNLEADPKVSNCTFRYNSANSDGGGMCNEQDSSPTVDNCTFENNTAAGKGGGMYSAHSSNPTVTNCTFNNNLAENEGGGMFNLECDSTVVNCAFIDNAADYGGGGLGTYISVTTLTNCLFFDNSADNGGGIWFYMGYPSTLINCTVSSNSAGYYGGGIYSNSIFEPITMTNCILWDNTDSSGSGTSAQFYGDPPAATFSCIKDSDPDDASIPFGGAANNNIDDNPLFENAGSGDLRLLPGSPCIETANNSAVPTDITDVDGDSITIEIIPWDLDSRPRLTDGDCDGTDTVDMGAYEFGWIYIGDLDGDCDIDFDDLAVTASHWLAGK